MSVGIDEYDACLDASKPLPCSIVKRRLGLFYTWHSGMDWGICLTQMAALRNATGAAYMSIQIYRKVAK